MYIRIFKHRKHLHIDEIAVQHFSISSRKVFFRRKTQIQSFQKCNSTSLLLPVSEFHE